VVAASHAELGERYLYCDQGAPLLFTENELIQLFGCLDAETLLEGWGSRALVFRPAAAPTPQR
jgi:hypothetical protein